MSSEETTNSSNPKKRKSTLDSSAEENSLKKCKQSSTSADNNDQLSSERVQIELINDNPSTSSSSFPLVEYNPSTTNEQVDQMETTETVSSAVTSPSTNLAPAVENDEFEDLLNYDLSHILSSSPSKPYAKDRLNYYEEELNQVLKWGREAKRDMEEWEKCKEIDRQIKEINENGIPKGGVKEKTQPEDKNGWSIHDRELQEFRSGFPREFLRFLPCDVQELDQLNEKIDKIESTLDEMFLMEDEFNAEKCFDMLRSICNFETNNYNEDFNTSAISNDIGCGSSSSGTTTCVSCSSNSTCGSSSNVSNKQTKDSSADDSTSNTEPIIKKEFISHSSEESKTTPKHQEILQIDIKLNKWRKICSILFNLGLKKLKSQIIDPEKDKEWLLFAAQFALHNLLFSSSLRAANHYEDFFFKVEKGKKESVYVEKEESEISETGGGSSESTNSSAQPENYYQIDMEQIILLFSLMDSNMLNELVLKFVDNFKFNKKISFSANWNQASSHYFPLFFFKTISSLSFGFNSKLYLVISKILLLIIRNSVDLESEITTERILQIQLVDEVYSQEDKKFLDEMLKLTLEKLSTLDHENSLDCFYFLSLVTNTFHVCIKSNDNYKKILKKFAETIGFRMLQSHLTLFNNSSLKT